ncbi:hypothetical protein SELMODRAFT_406082 [Selaginella moellendorffii]|uniref:Exportin-4 n=1 Tax=Selaginella moellendorffii TaxID=88036 RepID=D8R0M5_SELML|nr:hypothetical protein SELMODRAFT_406082 [Selaginella moellendorffii]
MEQQDLQCSMQAVEQSCAALHVSDPGIRSSAEATLLAFRKSPHPFYACQYILENSQVATAKFLAAATIQEAAIREWTLISPEEKSRLRSYCLQYVMARVETSEGYILSKILSVVAALLKRGWLEYTQAEKASFLEEVEQAVAGRHGLAAQRFGISLLEALVSEFSLSTASPMGLPAEFHDKCRASLEAGYLQKFYAWAFDASVMVASKALEGQGENQESAICTVAIRLMTQILNWEFRGKLAVLGKSRASTLSSSPASRKSSEQLQLWHDLLVSPAKVTWILNFYEHIHQKGNAWLDLPLSVVVRQLIVLMCSLNGSIFPTDGAGTQEQHLQRLLNCIISWIDPPEYVISAVLAGTSERQTGTLSLLSSLTCGIIKASCVRESEEPSWTYEALEVLLETWTVILQPADLSQKVPLPPSGIEAASAVFQTFVEFEMKLSESSALDEDDADDMAAFSDEAREDRLSAVALIARTVPSVSLSLLTMLVSKCFSEIRQSLGSETTTRCLEQLHWLTILSGHVLADPGEGETPTVPESILAVSAEPATHPAVSLSFALIDVAQQSLDATFRTTLSPRMMEAIVWFFGRWVETYLMPDHAGRGPSSTPSGHEGQEVSVGVLFDGRNALNAAFGKDGGGPAVLEILVRVALTSLTAWRGEQVLQEYVSSRLLPALVRRRNVCVQLLSMGSWQELATVFARQDQMLLSLSDSVQRALSGCLCRSAQGLANADAANQLSRWYVKDLLMPMAASLAEFSGRKDLATFSQQPNVIHQVSCVLERLRGAARETIPRTQKAIFEVGVSIMKPLLVFMEIYKNQPSVVYLLLKYVVVWVDAEVVFLEPKDTTTVFNFCVQLLSVYSAHNIGKVSVSTSRSLQNEAQTEKYKDLRALLQLLTNLSSKDLFDFALHADENPDVAQVVYLGLNIITPLISADLLKYPKLCRQYFTLLMHMLEVYPEKVAKISPEGFSQILGTLEFGLRQQDVEVVNMTLSALGALGVFQYQALCKGDDGLGTQSRTSGGDDVLSHFLKLLMHFLLFEDYSNDLVEPAADALLPLILCNTALFEKLKQELVQRHQDVVSQERVSTAFHSLSKGIEITSTIDRSIRRKFRSNLFVFLNDLRGFLRTR